MVGRNEGHNAYGSWLEKSCVQEEKNTLHMIDSMPNKKQAAHMTKIFNAMVEARQNCEAIAFRGHRLLDQVRAVQVTCADDVLGAMGELSTQFMEYILH